MSDNDDSDEFLDDAKEEYLDSEPDASMEDAASSSKVERMEYLALETDHTLTKHASDDIFPNPSFKANVSDHSEDSFDEDNKRIIVDNKWEVKPSANSALTEFYRSKIDESHQAAARRKANPAAEKCKKEPAGLHACGICGLTRRSLALITKHMVQRECLNPCPTCDFSARLFTDLFEHAMDKHEQRLFRCKFCHKIMDFESSAQHISEFHSDQEKRTRWQCDFCKEYYFGNNDAKWKHIQRHLRIEEETQCNVDWPAGKNVTGNKVCTKCDRAFVYEANFKSHLLKSHDHSCMFCDKSFTTAEKVLAHELAAHVELVDQEKTNVDRSVCKLCNRGFSNRSNLMKHCKNTHETFCVECEEFFATVDLLAAHVQLAHPELADVLEENSLYVCGKCNKKWQSKTLLIKHWKDMHGLVCEHCGQHFDSAELRMEHAYASHRGAYSYAKKGPNNHTCTVCGEGFTYLVRFQKHQERRHDWPCNYCDKMFPSQAALYRHEFEHKHKLADNTETESDGQDDGEKKRRTFHCNYCAKSFPVLRVLRVHIANSHATEEEKKKKLKWDCDECAAKFKSSIALREHKRSAHLGNITCEFCDSAFASKDELIFHLEMHLEGQMSITRENGAYVCTLCGHQCKTYVGTYSHQRMSHGRRPSIRQENVACNRCPMTFTSRAALSKHAVKHAKADKQWYVCGECGEEFLWRRQIIKHFKMHTRKQPDDSLSDDAGKEEKIDPVASLLAKLESGEEPALDALDGTVQIEKLEYDDYETATKRIKTENSDDTEDERGEHGSKTRRTTRPAIRKEFNCSECEKAFPLFRLLRVHVANAHPDVPMDFKCPDCNSPFMTQRKLDRHIANKRTKCGRTCEDCGAEFGTRARLVSHINAQCDTRKFQCSYCPQTYTRRCNVLAHVASVHEGRPMHRCDICNMGFKSYGM